MLTLNLMCGAPASGKSTFAENHLANSSFILSSDALRGTIGNSESDQNASAKTFAVMEIMAAYCLKRGTSVTIDAMNRSRKSRREFVAIARKYGARIVVYVATTSLENCKARNKARERFVPEYIIDDVFHGTEMPTIGEVDEIQTF